VKNLTIIVDNAERESAVVKRLREKSLVVEYANLRTGSYLISEAVAVERLSVKDFARLTSEKLLFRRLLEFKKTYAEPLVLIEGVDLFKSKQTSVGAIRGAISYICCLNRMPMLFTSNETETSEMLYIMANQTQFGLGYEVAVPEAARVGAGDGQPVKPKTPPEIQTYIVQALPDVGPALAKSIMKMYGNLRTLFSATPSDLTKVDGIGAKKAQKIVEVFDFNYESKNGD
jgi:ERCC4-type nuclease